MELSGKHTPASLQRGIYWIRGSLVPELVWTLCTYCMLLVLLLLTCFALFEVAEHIDWIYLKQKNSTIKRRKHDSVWRDIVNPLMTIDFKFQLLPRTEEFEILSTVTFTHYGHKCLCWKVSWQTILCVWLVL